MSINKYVTEALKDIGIPVSFQISKNEKYPYITFFTYLDRGTLHSDDEEKVTGYFIQIDIWSKNDYTDIAKEVHQSMLTANFIKQRYYDLYEKDTKVYHKVMRFLKEVEK
ncbi:hypothetical protein NE686_03775 [Tissierella carlieri]|uniref:Prohead protease n=1 Tax=Tissierella carlieri TaxID=689904 RepID=A0ABT1S6U4_9FIRM|nr:hypothetical protein [Tissierella carlieri]MCQ4922189.1 hypothetical protein [Tissierella carlieri]